MRAYVRFTVAILACVIGLAVPAVASAADLQRAEQNDPRIAYSGVWTTSTSTGYSGGTMSWGATGCVAAVAFSGTGVDLVVFTGPAYGTARVVLDSTDTTLVSLYAPTYRMKQVVYSKRGLSAGAHTLRMEHTGMSDPASMRTNISLDAVDVAEGELTSATPYVTRYEQNDSRLQYSGPWTLTSSPRYSGGSFRYATAAGSYCDVTFSGTDIALITSKGVNYGKVRITLDEGTPVLVDLYWPIWVPQQRVWASGSLADDTHTLRIECSGESTGAATAAFVGIDALDVGGVLMP
ncbi:MAG: hypothetical protein FDZ70_06935 [Actinobacteria bacterium]|nr:MAG: hypothetical protein FDZ70_06935 [Actinomycetota bacterium]